MSERDLLTIGAILLVFLGVLVILTTGLMFFGSMMLGTGAVGWYLLDHKDRVSHRDFDEIERYANKGDDT